MRWQPRSGVAGPGEGAETDRCAESAPARLGSQWPERQPPTVQPADLPMNHLKQTHIHEKVTSPQCSRNTTLLQASKKKAIDQAKMSAPVSSPPTGVFVPVPTFLKPASASSGLQPKVDVETQVKHSVFLAKNGIRGLVLLGSTGEAIHLNKQERFDLIAGCRKGLDDAGFPDYPIMAGVLTNGIDETLEWLHDYAKAGAQWGLVLVPGYFGAAGSQANIQEWYTIIADNSPIPILM